MILRLLTILSLIGLLLSVGLLAASFWGVGYHCRSLNPTKVLAVDTVGGTVLLRHEGVGIATFWGWHSMPRSRQLLWWRMPSWYIGGNMFRILIPLWLPIVLFAAYPTYQLPAFRRHLQRHRRRKRKKLGLCVKCGYDLRASNDRCPECGEDFGSTGVEG
ncbi:MAG: hypothetical protein IID34_00245 [Planctomycetes bacterium]|nr:hypothetical protein [Planctomycetota bacterium]